MDSIPAEVLVRILGCIDPIYDALIRYSRVSTAWRDTIQNAPALWNHIHIKTIWITSTEQSMLKHCLVRFNRFIRCVRVCDYHNDVFLDGTMRELVRDLPSLRCLDVPLLLWDLDFLESFQSAEHLQELNMYGFGNSEMNLWPSLIHDPHPPFLLTQDHFQILQQRFRSVKTLKISLNMLDCSQLDLMTFLDALNPSELQITVFARSYSGPSFHFIGINGLRHLLSSVHVSAITALQLHDVAIGHKETRLILKNLPALLRLRLVFDPDRICRNPYQFLQSDTLRELVLDGLPAVYIKHLRCSMPSLVILKLSRCPLVVSAAVSSPVLRTLQIANVPKLRDFRVESTRLKECEISKCRTMSREARLVKFLGKHRHITDLKMCAKVECLRLDGACCDSLSVLDIQVQCMNSFVKFKIDCPTLKFFKFRSNLGRANHGQLQRNRSLIMNADFLDHVDIHSPGVSTLVVQCNELRSLNLSTESSTWDEDSPAVDFHLIVSRDLCQLFARMCRFSRFKLECGMIAVVHLVTCKFSGPLKLQSYFVYELRVRECGHITELHVQTTSLRTNRISLVECERLTNVIFDVTVQENGETTPGEVNSLTPRPPLQRRLGGSRPDKVNEETAKPGPLSLFEAQRSPDIEKQSEADAHSNASPSPESPSSISSGECFIFKRASTRRRLRHIRVQNCASFWLSDRPFQERLIKRQLDD